MWNSVKSIKLSTIFTKVIIGLVIILACALPFIVKKTSLAEMFMLNTSELSKVLVIIYICCAIALVALYSLNKLLSNISREIVFVKQNVDILRRISWCCFIVALVLLPGSLFSLVFFMLSVMAGFVGLILRVVKNVFEAAVRLKDENDYTI